MEITSTGNSAYHLHFADGIVDSWAQRKAVWRFRKKPELKLPELQPGAAGPPKVMKVRGAARTD
jgi:hypothetical protein